MVVAVYGTVRVFIFVIGASVSGPLKALHSVRRGVWRPPCASRADMATTLGLFSRPLGFRDADLSGPRY